MIGVILLSFGSAIVGAALGAYLQKRWTPNLAPELKALRGQLTAFQQRIETLEQERIDAAHLPIFVSLERGEHSKYTLLARNESDEEILVQSVGTLRDGIELSALGRPTQPDDWRIAPHSSHQLSWVPNPDPVGTLGMSRTRPAPGAPIEIEFVLYCTIRGKPIVLRRKILVGVDLGNYRMEQVNPKA
jgi:hypothetical protein